MRFDENLFTDQCEKEDKKALEFQISRFYWSFSSDIMAVKGLMIMYCFLCHCSTGAHGPLHGAVIAQWI